MTGSISSRIARARWHLIRCPSPNVVIGGRTTSQRVADTRLIQRHRAWKGAARRRIDRRRDVAFEHDALFLDRGVGDRFPSKGLLAGKQRMTAVAVRAG